MTKRLNLSIVEIISPRNGRIILLFLSVNLLPFRNSDRITSRYWSLKYRSRIEIEHAPGSTKSVVNNTDDGRSTPNALQIHRGRGLLRTGHRVLTISQHTLRNSALLRQHCAELSATAGLLCIDQHCTWAQYNLSWFCLSVHPSVIFVCLYNGSRINVINFKNI